MPLFSVTVREHAYTGIFYSDVVEAGSARDAVTVAGARAEARPWFPEDAAPAPVPPRGFSVVVRGQAGAGPLYSDTVQAGSAAEALVDCYRAIAGEHPDWDGYRRAMIRQDKSLLRITPISWGPVATGGFPARLAG